MAGFSACCPTPYRLPTIACAGILPGTACANPGCRHSGLSIAHTDSHAHAETHRYPFPATDAHADARPPDRDASPHCNALSAPANANAHFDPAPAHQDSLPYGDAQAAHAHTHECPSLSAGAAGPARSLTPLSWLSKGAGLYRRPYQRRCRESVGWRAAGVL